MQWLRLLTLNARGEHLIPDQGIKVSQPVKNLPAMWEIQVQSLGWEDPLEKGMATHFSILAWRIPWAEWPGRLQSVLFHRAGHD